MTPQERKEFNEMKQMLENIRSAEDVIFIQNAKRRVAGGTVSAQSGASTTGTSVAVRNAADTGSETVAEQYDGVLTLTDNLGNTYRVGYYS